MALVSVLKKLSTRFTDSELARGVLTAAVFRLSESKSDLFLFNTVDTYTWLLICRGELGEICLASLLLHADCSTHNLGALTTLWPRSVRAWACECRSRRCLLLSETVQKILTLARSLLEEARLTWLCDLSVSSVRQALDFRHLDWTLLLCLTTSSPCHPLP